MLKWYFTAGLSLALIITIVGLAMSRNYWRNDAVAMHRSADRIVVELQKATGNPDADWKSAPGQIIALGESRKALKQSVDIQNERIDSMAKEAVRLRAKADELRVLADKAQAQRRAAYSKLSQEAITPGTRDDCMQLLREAEDALDMIREAGA